MGVVNGHDVHSVLRGWRGNVVPGIGGISLCDRWALLGIKTIGSHAEILLHWMQTRWMTGLMTARLGILCQTTRRRSRGFVWNALADIGGV